MLTTLFVHHKVRYNNAMDASYTVATRSLGEGAETTKQVVVRLCLAVSNRM
jgi:hypothetical protein